MSNVSDFIHAALPWVAAGLLLAIFFVTSNAKKKKDSKQQDYGTEGMCVGMCFGSAFSAALGYNMGLGISLGMLFGLAIGSAIQKPDRNDQDQQHGRQPEAIYRKTSARLPRKAALRIFCAEKQNRWGLPLAFLKYDVIMTEKKGE